MLYSIPLVVKESLQINSAFSKLAGRGKEVCSKPVARPKERSKSVDVTANHVCNQSALDLQFADILDMSTSWSYFHGHSLTWAPCPEG